MSKKSKGLSALRSYLKVKLATSLKLGGSQKVDDEERIREFFPLNNYVYFAITFKSWIKHSRLNNIRAMTEEEEDSSKKKTIKILFEKTLKTDS